MADRDRLIELIKAIEKDPAITCPHWNENDCFNCFNCPYDKEETCDMEARKADYLLANGVIVPPCKVGDVVYSSGYDWQKAKDVIVPYQITNITITQNKKCVWTKKYRAMRILNGKTIDCQLNFEFDTIGKTVFLTKEKAEKALKEREG